MLDVRRIRSDLDGVTAALGRRGEDGASLREIAELDAQVRHLGTARDELRSRIRAMSTEIGALHREGHGDAARELQSESRALGEQEKALDHEAEHVADRLREALLRVPNLPADEAPDGASENDNVVVRTHEPDGVAYGPHQRVPHWEIGDELGILDVGRAVRMSGSMFVMYRAAGAALVRALIQLTLDRNSDLFEEVRPPTLVRVDTMIATGHLPKFADDAYEMERDGLYAIPTAEVPLTSMHRDEILPFDSLPRRYMAHTSCFRRESGSAGKDTRGLLRVHEFDKVEILAVCAAEQAPELHRELMARAEGLIADLGLAYRVLDLCTGDLGNSSARTFDIEVYAPGVDRYLEVSSVSWFSDYQARRAAIRTKRPGGSGTEICHTLNGSAVAVPRVWAALVETYRQPDGSVTVPELLRPYMRGLEVIR